MWDVCAQCGHPFGVHSIVSLTGDLGDGGITLCPVPGCRCLSTWSMQGRLAPAPPPDEQIEAIRGRLQGGASRPKAEPTDRLERERGDLPELRDQ